MKKRNVIVLGLFINGASVVRTLSQNGYQVWGVTDNPKDVGLLSLYGKKLICSNPEEDLDKWIKFMTDISKEFSEKAAVIPTSDKYVLAMTKAAYRLKKHFRFHGFETDLRTNLTLKTKQLRLAEKYGFPVPKYAFISTLQDLLEFSKCIKGQVIIKPEISHAWRQGKAQEVIGDAKVMLGEGEEELTKIYKLVKPFTKRLLAMEYIPGGDENLYYWTGFIDNGRICGSYIGQKNRTTPIHFGSASAVQLVDLPNLDKHCEKFLKKLNYKGLCGIEVKQDPRDKEVKLIEINPRYGLWEEMGIPVGINLAKQAVDSLFGEKQEKIQPKSFKQRWVSLHRDIPVLPGYLKDGLSIGELIRSYSPPIVVNDFPLTDPIYSFRFALYYLGLLIKKIFSQK